MNELFVNVKVDREERPDVDALYMQATLSLAGQGGWPMTVFLTPDGAPVLRRHLLPAHGARRACRPSPTCAGRSPSAYRNRRDDVESQAARGRAAARPPRPSASPGGEALERAERWTTPSWAWPAIFDPVEGGFGGAPEVPALAGARVPAAPPLAPARTTTTRARWWS